MIGLASRTEALDFTVPLTLVHVEDDADWRRELRDTVREVADVIYWPIHDPVDLSLPSLMAKSLTTKVFVFDLRLRDYGRSVDETLDWLSEHAPRIMAAGHEVVVLSAFLPESTRARLIAAGIPVEYILSKDEWDSVQFAQLLREARAQQGRHLDLLRSQRLVNSPEVCRLHLRLVEADSGVECTLLKLGCAYRLSITIKSQESLRLEPALIGAEVVVHASSVGVEVLPVSATFYLPEPNGEASIEFAVVPEPIRWERRERDLQIMFFRGGSLMSVCDMGDVLPAR